jgi:hypothetical protein
MWNALAPLGAADNENKWLLDERRKYGFDARMQPLSWRAAAAVAAAAELQLGAPPKSLF